jgi:hypothetical protein
VFGVRCSVFGVPGFGDLSATVCDELGAWSGRVVF